MWPGTRWRRRMAPRGTLNPTEHEGWYMPARGTAGKTALERLLRRYESTATKCPACGYVDESGNWTSRTSGGAIVYHHVCPSCGAGRDHRFSLDR